MNSLHRVEAVMQGKIPDRVPVCLHNFLLAAKEAGIPLAKCLSDPAATAAAHLDALEKYGHDCILVDLDTTMIAEAMGARRDFTENEPGHIAAPAIKSLDEVAKLRPVDPARDGRIPVLVEAIRLLGKAVGQEVAIRGNCDQGAFALAGLLRGMEDFMMDLMEDPDRPELRQLLEVAHQSHVAVHQAVKAAGAHFTSLGDSAAGPDVVSPAVFQKFARPYQERLIRELNWPVVIHICGNTSAILDQFTAYPFCGFELDYKTDTALAKATAGKQHVLFGNIDPSGVISRGTPALVRQATRQLMEQWKPGGLFVLNAGCAIPQTTPPENVHALVAAAKEFGAYD